LRKILVYRLPTYKLKDLPFIVRAKELIDEDLNILYAKKKVQKPKSIGFIAISLNQTIK
jgi:hypothetical protein